jgi:CheY-like chemotaxis protein
MGNRTVLCVDDEDAVDATSAVLAAGSDLEPVTRTSVEGARQAIEEEPVACVVTEYDLADGTGLEVVETIRAEAPQTPCVLYTDTRPGEIDTASFEEVIVEYVSKDFPDAGEQLSFIVDDLIDHSAQVGFLKPDDEESRLEALESYDIDELPIQESFDRLTDLIADFFDVEVSFIGLVEEDEEDFLACTGADWDSLTREDTICTHSMLQEDVMVVEDVQQDSRFSENEQLRNLGIRSYAGANMTTPDGHVIGQVCVLDGEPRDYSESERERLQQFAETAMEILELRQSLREARPEVAA